MKTVTQFDRATCKTVGAALEAAVQTVAQQYGLLITTGSGSFSDNTFSLKIECATKNEDGTVNTMEAEDFKFHCSRWDLEEGMLNKAFVDPGNGQRYRVAGAKPRSRKYPIIVVKEGTGERYKFPASRVKRAFDVMAVEG